MVVTISYSRLEYSLIKLVGPRRKVQITLTLGQNMFQTSNFHSNQLIEAYYTAGTSKSSVMHRF